MATVKKTTTKKPAQKKPVAKKAAPAKKTVATKTTVKKTTVAKSITPVKAKKATKQAKTESFKVSKEPSTFMSFKITEQTVYWSILLIYIMLLVLWISNIQLETMRIIDSIRIS